MSVGVACGLASGMWTSKLIRSLLFGLASWRLGCVTVATVGVAASLVPAWRASRLDPSEVLRES